MHQDGFFNCLVIRFQNEADLEHILKRPELSFKSLNQENEKIFRSCKCCGQHSKHSKSKYLCSSENEIKFYFWTYQYIPTTWFQSVASSCKEVDAFARLLCLQDDLERAHYFTDQDTKIVNQSQKDFKKTVREFFPCKIK